MDFKKINLLKQAAVKATNDAIKTGNPLDHADAIRANMDWLDAQIEYDTKRRNNLANELELLLKDDLKSSKKTSVPRTKKVPSPMTKNVVKKTIARKRK